LATGNPNDADIKASVKTLLKFLNLAGRHASTSCIFLTSLWGTRIHLRMAIHKHMNENASISENEQYLVISQSFKYEQMLPLAGLAVGLIADEFLRDFKPVP